MPGDTIFLRAHTNMMVEVEGDAVQARWGETGLWQSLKIEKANLRRLAETAVDTSPLGALLGAAAVVLAVATLVIALVAKSALMRDTQEIKAFHSDCSYKVQPMQDEDEEVSVR